MDKFRRHFDNILNNNWIQISRNSAISKLQETYKTDFKSMYQDEVKAEMSREIAKQAHQFDTKMIYELLDTFYLGLKEV